VGVAGIKHWKRIQF